ncbi:MAG: LCP family protein [Nitriliruptoraceae bacterium]
MTTKNTIWTSNPDRRARVRPRWHVLGSLVAIITFSIAVVSGAVLALDRSLTRVEVDGLGDASGDDGGGARAAPGAGDGSDGPESTDHIDELDAEELDAEIDIDAEPLTVLLLGSDTREVLTAEEQQQLGTGAAWGERTEVVALLRIDAAADELRMVNIPRDSVVPRCNGTSGRINAAYGIGERSGAGGMSCVVQTVSRWSDVAIDHAVKVDFRGFLAIVEAIGGIELYIEEPMRDQRANLDLQPGCQVLDGAGALAFARARHLDNDFGRISRQQRLLVEMRDQARENGVFSNPVRTLRFAEAVAAALQVDDSLTLNRIRQLVMDHRGTLQQPLEARTVPGTADTSGEAWLLQPDEEAAAELFTWLLEGDADAEHTSRTAVDDSSDAGAGGRGGSSDGGDGGDGGGDGGDGGGDGGDGGDGGGDDENAPIGSDPRRCD